MENGGIQIRKNFTIFNLADLKSVHIPVTSADMERMVTAQSEADKINGYLIWILVAGIEAEMVKLEILRPHTFDMINFRIDLLTGAWEIFMIVLSILHDLIKEPVGPKVCDRLRRIFCLFHNPSEFREFRNFQKNVIDGNLEQTLIDLRRILQITHVKVLGPTLIYPHEPCKRGKYCTRGEKCILIHE